MNYRIYLSICLGVLCQLFQVKNTPALAQTPLVQTSFDLSSCSQRSPVRSSQDCVNELLVFGRNLVGSGDFVGALTLYQRAAQLTSNNAYIHSAIGFLEIRQHNFQAAAQAFQTAVALEPTNSRFYYALGYSLAYLGDDNGAENAYREAIRLHPTDADAHLSFGIILTRKKEYHRALLAHATALALQPDNPQIYQAIGAVYLKLGKHQEANVFFERAGQLSYQPNSLLKQSENGLIGYRR